jgi:hypothetical protein
MVTGNSRQQNESKSCMNRLAFKLLSFLVAFGYSWVLTLTAGTVLCVGVDGHLAIEPIVGRHCQESASSPAAGANEAGDRLPSWTAADCVDTPVQSPQALASRGKTSTRLQPWSSGNTFLHTTARWALSTAGPSLVPSPSGLWLASACPHASLASLRTVVLRL